MCLQTGQHLFVNDVDRLIVSNCTFGSSSEVSMLCQLEILVCQLSRCEQQFMCMQISTGYSVELEDTPAYFRKSYIQSVKTTSWKTEFAPEESSVTLKGGVQMKLSHARIKLINNNFSEGSGIIEVDTSSLKEADILANTFNGASFEFTGAQHPTATHEKVFTLRNNVFQNGSRFNTSAAPWAAPKRCDDSAQAVKVPTGQAAGCDNRAECTEPDFIGNVQCNCPSPLEFKAGWLRDRSKCEMHGQVLDVFHAKREIDARVRKPKNLTLHFDISAQSDVTFNATIVSTELPLLSIDAIKSDLEFVMSSAKSMLDKQFLLAVLGSAANFSDSESKKAVIIVGSTSDQAQKTNAARQHQRGTMRQLQAH